jgi:hypothetical protein
MARKDIGADMRTFVAYGKVPSLSVDTHRHRRFRQAHRPESGGGGDLPRFRRRR